jgi:hypothetical protein
MRPIHSISVANKRSLWGYKGDSVSPFLKITVAELKSYPKVRGAFERGDVTFRSLFDGSAMMTFESNIAYTLRFMIDHKVSWCAPRWRPRRASGREGAAQADEIDLAQIVGMNWIELPKGTYQLRTERDKISNCQLEVDTQCARFLPFSSRSPSMTDLTTSPRYKDTTLSSRTLPKARRGRTLRPSGSCRSISSAPVGRVSSLSRTRIQSFRSPTWSRGRVSLEML